MSVWWWSGFSWGVAASVFVAFLLKLFSLWGLNLPPGYL